MIAKIQARKGEGLLGNNLFLNFLYINVNLWNSATPFPGNVRAGGLPAPVHDEWSTMWRKTSNAKTDQKSFYKAINDGGGGVYRFVSFSVGGTEKGLIM